MEPVCPMVDAFLLDWLSKGPLKREWFFEERDGNCRLMGPFAQLIAETALNWRREVAPYAERAAHIFWASAKSKSAHLSPATRLTQSYRRMAKGKEPLPSSVKASESPRLCKLCGTHIMGRHKFCSECAPTNSKEALIVAALRAGSLPKPHRSWLVSVKSKEVTDLPSATGIPPVNRIGSMIRPIPKKSIRIWPM